MKNLRSFLSLLLLALTFLSSHVFASETIQLENGWSFKYIAIGSNIILTEVETSGENKLVIPSTVEIEGENYTIKALKNGLFSNNEELKRITIPSSLTSLNAEVETQTPENHPYANNPITLLTPIESTDIWQIKAVINTGGEQFNQWGTALFASGEIPNADHYPGGFQFWLNNGTSNSNGRILIKYGTSSYTYTFNDGITIMPGGTNDVSVSLSYDGDGNYIAILSSEGNTEKKTVALPTAFAGFSKLSSAITQNGTFSELEISTYTFTDAAGALSNVPNLAYVSVSQSNPVYASENGSLYDANKENVLIDLSEYNSRGQEIVSIGDGWSFNYQALGTEIILTKVVASGNETLVIPPSVEIAGVTYTIIAIAKDLFSNNTTLKRLSLPATLTSLAANIETETPETKPAIDSPITLTSPVTSEGTWITRAIVNTGGQYFNSWGTALLATGEIPNLDDYTGGFQFWLNNGTASGDNSTGTLVYKYGAGTTKHVFSDQIKVQSSSAEDISIVLAYKDGRYTAIASCEGITLNFSVNATCSGFSKLSSAIPAAGTFSLLEISKFSFEATAGNLGDAPNLEWIEVDDLNTIYSSVDGSLYDKSGENLLLNLGKYIYTWIGTTSSNWDTATNWQDGLIPEAESYVLISGNQTNYPEISESTTVGSLTLKEGAKLDFAATKTLTVTGKVNVEKNVNSFTWYPIGFPFAARAHYMDFGDESELILASQAADTSADFWLKAYSGTEFAYMTTYPMAAGTGYIAQYPSAFDNKIITYISEGTDPVVLSNGSITAESEVYKLVANPTLSAMNVKSENGTFYYTFDGSKFIILEEGNEATVQPFEAFIVVSTETPDLLKSSIGSEDGDLTGIETEIAPEGKIIEVRYYNLQGTRIAAPVANEVYIEKAVYESGEEVVTKIVNPKK